MAQWILWVDGRVISRQTVRPLSEEELCSPMEVARRKAFDIAIKRKLGDSISIPKREEPTEYVPYKDDDIGVDDVGLPETDEDQYDWLINSEVLLPHQDKQSHAVVVGRHSDKDGNLIGMNDSYPILNTALYDVAFPDGTVKKYAANTILRRICSHRWIKMDINICYWIQLLVIDHQMMMSRYQTSV